MNNVTMQELGKMIASEGSKASLNCSFKYNSEDPEPKDVVLNIDFSGVELEHLVAEGLKHLVVPAQARLRKGTLEPDEDSIVNVKYDDILPKKKIGEQGRRSKLSPEQKANKLNDQLAKLPEELRQKIIQKYMDDQS